MEDDGSARSRATAAKVAKRNEKQPPGGFYADALGIRRHRLRTDTGICSMILCGRLKQIPWITRLTGLHGLTSVQTVFPGRNGLV